MSERPGQPQRYCGNCGAEIRLDTAFCVSCGAPLASGSGQSGPEPPRSSGRSGSLIEDLKTRFQSITSGLGEAFSGLNAAGVRQVSGRALEWFKDLPGVPKLVIVGLLGLILLVVLSPVAMIAAALVLGVSIIALIYQVIYKGPIKSWGIAAVVSVVLLLTFGGISGALYGIGFMGGGESVSSGQDGGRGGAGTPSSGGGDFPATTPSPAASPSALPNSGQITFTGKIFGYSETFDYDGLTVTGTIVDWNGDHIMVFQDPMQGGGFMLGSPGDEVTVSGEYQGTITTSNGGSYEAVMAEDVKSPGQ